MVITDEPAVQSARLLSLAPKLYPSNKQHMLTLSVVTRLMQSVARVRQNRASEAKRALLAGCEHNIILYIMMWNLKVPSNRNLRLTLPVNLDLMTCISPFSHDLLYSPYSPKVLVFSPIARPFFPNFNSLWVQASRTDLSVLAQAFHRPFI